MTKRILQMSLLSLSLICSALASAQNYRVLISNDDGIESPLIIALQQELAALPGVDVVVSAPNENKSGSSQSSSSGPMSVEKIERDGQFFGYAVYGTPADAVRFGITTLSEDQPFDLVVSGINRGANVGDVSHLSGTIGAAMQALYMGVPAIAISQDTQGVDTEASARFAAQLVKRYQQYGAPVDRVLSINIPRGELQGVRVRPMGDAYLQTGAYTVLEQSGDRTVYQRERLTVPSEDASSDTYAYQHGFVTITPLKFDWTDYELISEVDSWNLQLSD